MAKQTATRNQKHSTHTYIMRMHPKLGSRAFCVTRGVSPASCCPEGCSGFPPIRRAQQHNFPTRQTKKKEATTTTKSDAHDGLTQTHPTLPTSTFLCLAVQAVVAVLCHHQKHHQQGTRRYCTCRTRYCTPHQQGTPELNLHPLGGSAG